MPSPTPDSSSHDRETIGSLGAGLFTNGVWDMVSIIVPLYAVAVGLSASQIGLVIAARSILPTALSIHGGIVMDTLGTRRVLLWVAMACVVLPVLYPASGWFAVLFTLQLLHGFASSLAMGAAQTWSLQTSHGDTATIARFTLFSRIGTFLGPVMVGAIWDWWGPWAAFSAIALWGAGTAASAAYGKPGDSEAPPPSRARAATALIPNWRQHKEAIALAAIPAVAFILAVSFLRNAPGAVQASLYVVYLADAGWSGTIIGALVAFCELCGVFGSIMAAALERRMRAERLVVVCLAASIAAIAITPLVGAFLTLLFAAAALRGFSQGVSQPLMYSVLGRNVPSTTHGRSIGLRTAVVRLGSIITPAAMGVVAEAWGIAASFYVVGGILLAATGGLMLYARRFGDAEAC